jgi:acyl-CoA reductase-like NAD-dependent aldehyde dehydrogenase
MEAGLTSTVPAATEPGRLDAAVARVRGAAPGWARASLSERIALARSMLAGLHRVAPRLVHAGCVAKGLPLDAPSSGDEWLAAAYIPIRALGQLARHLETLARTGNVPVGRMSETDDGRVAERVFPSTPADAGLFLGIHADVHYLAGVRPEDARARRARFHKSPDHAGRVCVVLGAGNVNAIPILDLATKLFNEGKVCVLKVNPVNAYIGPILEDAFAEAIARGLVAVVQGGADEGEYLVHHPGVDEVHLTGSNETHDRVVWGPPGPEREARKVRNDPVLKKEITSELGDVSPVLVVPGRWDERSLAFQAESVAGMVTQNGSFNCLAARMVVLPRAWKLRDRFLDLVARYLASTPARRAWYPGAKEKLAAFVAGRPHVRASAAPEGTLPWTLVTGVDAQADDPAYANECFCPVLVETSIASEDPLEFLGAAAAFANERLPGTLSAQIVASGPTLADPTTGAAVRDAVRRLEYGSVGVNCSGAYTFGYGTTPWGGFPGQPLQDPCSGRGFVHNTLMLEGIEKTVAWAPAVHFVKPPYFPTHRTLHRLGRRMVEFEARRDWRQLPGIVWDGLRG